MNDIVIRAIKALRISQTMHAGPSKEVDAIIAEMEALDLAAEKARADAAVRRLMDVQGGKHVVHDEVYAQHVESWQERAYAAEAKVCELVDLATTARSTANTTGWVGNAAALVAAAADSTADIRAKWCPVSEVIGAFTEAGLALGVHSTMGLDAHIKRIVDDSAATIRERDEVGVQLVAAQAEIARLQGKLSDAIAHLLANNLGCVSDALGILRHADAVPGDALVARGPYTDEGSNGFVERAGKGTTNPDKKGGAE